MKHADLGTDYTVEHLGPTKPNGRVELEETVEFSTITLAALSRLKLPSRELVLAPVLSRRGLAMLFAGRGLGKTYTAMGAAYAVACGGEFLRWRAPKPRRV